MKFTCDKCHTRHAIQDAKVRGKVLKVRCMGCSRELLIRGPALPGGSQTGRAGRQGQGAAVGSGASAGPLVLPPEPLLGDTRASAALDLRRDPQLTGPLPALTAAQPAVAPAESARQELPDEPWYLALDEQQFGPMSRAELCQRISRGEAGAGALVWREGQDDWAELEQLPELWALVPRRPPPMPAQQTAVELPSPLPAAPDPTPLARADWHELHQAPAVPAPRTHWLMRLTAAGGITAGLCGITLVVHTLLLAPPVTPARTVQRQPAPRPLGTMILEQDDQPVPATPDQADLEPMVIVASEPRRPGRPARGKARARRRRAPRAAPAQHPLPGLSAGPLPGVTSRPRPVPPRVSPLAEVQALLRRNQRGLQTCHGRAVKHGVAPNTVVAKFKLEIGVRGKVRQAQVVAQGIDELEACLARRVQRWRFAPGEERTVTFKSVFQVR